MAKSDKRPEGVRFVEALRISTGDTQSPGRPDTVGVVLERPVTIDVEGVETYTVLCTPRDRRALALGFLFSEGVIESLDEVAVLKRCEDDIDTVRVRLKGGRPPRIADQGRNLLIVSSCGACGSANLEERIAALPFVGKRLKFESRLLRAVNADLRSCQELFESCGGTHAAGIFDENGQILSCAEDTGRHNALDKAIGMAMLEGTSTAGCGAVLSGRVSLEMVSKSARAGVELISAISAPTALAIEVAERCGITLCTFVREDRATVFTHPERIAGA